MSDSVWLGKALECAAELWDRKLLDEKGIYHSEYVGEWKDSQLHGQGVYTLPSGVRMVGEFKDGLLWTVIVYDKNGSVVSKAEEGVVTKIGEDDKNVMDDTNNK